MVTDQRISPPENLGRGSSCKEFCLNKPPVLSSTGQGRQGDGKNGPCRREGAWKRLRAPGVAQSGRKGFLGAGLPTACLCSPGITPAMSSCPCCCCLFAGHIATTTVTTTGRGTQGPASRAWPLNTQSPSLKRETRTICKGENSSCLGVRHLASGWPSTVSLGTPLPGLGYLSLHEIAHKPSTCLKRLQETSNR